MKVQCNQRDCKTKCRIHYQPHEKTKDCEEYKCEAIEVLAKCEPICSSSIQSDHGCYYGYGQDKDGINNLISDLKFFEDPVNKILFIFEWCPLCGERFSKEHIEKLEKIIYENTKIK